MSAPSSETTNPIEMKAAPQLPTSFASTPAIDGSGTPASSACAIKPYESKLTISSSANTPTKPSTVARPTSLRLAARCE